MAFEDQFKPITKWQFRGRKVKTILKHMFGKEQTLQATWTKYMIYVLLIYTILLIVFVLKYVRSP